MAVPEHSCSRRWLLLGGLAAGVAVAVAMPRAAAAADGDGTADADNEAAADTQSDLAFAVPAGEAVLIERFSIYGRSLATMEVPRIIRSDEQWRVRLPSLAYEVTRQGGNEPAFSGQYLHNRAAGLYRCICCGTALFDSRTQFEPGTGWLNFHAPISPYNVAESLESESDAQGDVHHLAVCCRRCDAHLGTVFDDGPAPTRLRYRIDSVALHFVPYPSY